MLTLSEAARKLGISRAALDNWIKRLEIEKKKEGQIGLTTKEVEQIRKHRRSNSRRRDTDMTVTSSGRGAPAFVEQELKELKQVREQLQDLSEERLQWHKERSQHHDREESKRKELKNWEARLTETQRRADWLQEQLDSNSREKKELLKQADQFQQLLLEKERSLQKILEEKQKLQQRLHLLGEEEFPPATSEEEFPTITAEASSAEKDLLVESELPFDSESPSSAATTSSLYEEEESKIQDGLNDIEEASEVSVELEDDEADLMLFDESEDDEEISNEFPVEEKSIKVDTFEEPALSELASTEETPVGESDDAVNGWDRANQRQFSEFAGLFDEIEAQVARRYLGFGEERQSLETIAFALSIPVSEVRQIAGRAVLKIRSYHLQLRQSGPPVDV
jgi:hypothetical protein